MMAVNDRPNRFQIMNLVTKVTLDPEEAFVLTNMNRQALQPQSYDQTLIIRDTYTLCICHGHVLDHRCIANIMDLA